MEQLPANDRLSYFRILILMVLLFVVDLLFIAYSIMNVVSVGPSIVILFGFEYTLLSISVVTTSIKFSYNLISLSSERPWEDKGAYVLYLEFVSNTCKILVYTAFFILVFKYYGIPIHMFRSVYFAWGRFYQSYVKLIKYRRAVLEMNLRFLDATEQELQTVDRICIVCREEMVNAKKLPCGHVLHKACLVSWLESSQECPLCRAPVLVEDLPLNAANPQQQQLIQLMQQLLQQNQQNPPAQNPAPQNNVPQIHTHSSKEIQNENDLGQEKIEEANSLGDAVEKLDKVQQEIEKYKQKLEALQNQVNFLQNFIMENVEKSSGLNFKEEQIGEIEQKEETKKLSIIKQLNESNENVDLQEIRRRRVLKFSSSSSQGLRIEEDDK